MKCRNCSREIDDESIYCKWCGEMQLRQRRKAKTISVPKAEQLPSGKWRIQLKREKKSITAYTKRLCEEKALAFRRDFLAKQEQSASEEEVRCLSLGSAIDSYLADRSEILSPSTLRSYTSMRKYRLQRCMDWNIFDPANNWQSAINQEYREELSEKTIKNAWRLCTAAMKSAGATVPDVKLKRVTQTEHEFLRYDQIMVFLDAVKGKDFELGALLALNSLRLSELLALKPCNVSADGLTLSVRGSRVLNSYGELEYKTLNKTDKSRRDIPVVIPRLEELLGQIDRTREYVVDSTEKRLYDKINRLCKQNGLPSVGVHGLRHSFASLAYHLGWKRLSTMAVGGWTDSKIIDEIYTHNADLDTDVESMKSFFRE